MTPLAAWEAIALGVAANLNLVTLLAWMNAKNWRDDYKQRLEERSKR